MAAEIREKGLQQYMGGKGKRVSIKMLIGLAFMICSVTGCGRLKSDLTVATGIRQALPDAVFLDKETGARSGDYEFKRFTVENRGVIFTYENYQGADTFFGGKVAFSGNDYCEKLFEYFSEEIEEITDQYQVELNEVHGSHMEIRNRISHMEDIDSGVKAMQEIYLLLEDYIPQTELSWFPFELALCTDYGKVQHIFIVKQGDWDESYARQLLYLNFKADVDTGMVTDVELSEELLDTIPQKYIRALYINGKPYCSDDYEICFLYNLKDGKYYTRAGFGIELEYNGGVEDHLQREIIEACYPDSGYTISMDDQTSAWQIGDDHYLVKRQEDGLIFSKNDCELQIEYDSEISGTNTGATYYYWISVDDFAMLMGMTVEKVEENGVYLKCDTCKRR